ncbi:hypothetical protein ACTFIU_003635 [Dictyostelium citrinum]
MDFNVPMDQVNEILDHIKSKVHTQYFNQSPHTLKTKSHQFFENQINIAKSQIRLQQQQHQQPPIIYCKGISSINRVCNALLWIGPYIHFEKMNTMNKQVYGYFGYYGKHSSCYIDLVNSTAQTSGIGSFQLQVLVQSKTNNLIFTLWLNRYFEYRSIWFNTPTTSLFIIITNSTTTTNTLTINLASNYFSISSAPFAIAETTATTTATIKSLLFQG